MGAVEQALDAGSDGAGFRLCWRRGSTTRRLTSWARRRGLPRVASRQVFGVCAGPVAEAGEECVVGFGVGIEFHPIEADGFVGKAPSLRIRSMVRSRMGSTAQRKKVQCLAARSVTEGLAS